MVFHDEIHVLLEECLEILVELEGRCGETTNSIIGDEESIDIVESLDDVVDRGTVLRLSD